MSKEKLFSVTASDCRWDYYRAPDSNKLGGPKPISVFDKFCRYIPKYISENNCWEWCGATDTKYGVLRVKENEKWKNIKAHRISYELFKGIISNGLYVMHMCDNPICVNPNHLILGTYKNNTQDALSKNRMLKGSLNGQSILTEKDIPIIFRLHRQGLSNSKIGKKFNVHRRTISDIVNKKTWKHVEVKDETGRWVDEEKQC